MSVHDDESSPNDSWELSKTDVFCDVPQEEDVENEIPMNQFSFHAGDAFLSQAGMLSEQAAWIRDTGTLVNSQNDLLPHQWAQFMTMATAFGPDLILEIGRGNGNSTCCFTQAIHCIGNPSGRVVSICRARDWRTRIRPILEKDFPADWFAPLTALEGELGEVDFAHHLADAKRVLVLWDAHGWEVAEIMLGRLMPLLADREHLVMMHDIGDLVCNAPETLAYTARMWRGSESEGAMLYLPPFITNVAQTICAIDFCHRNAIELHSAEAEITSALNCAAGENKTTLESIPTELVHGSSYWVWFSLQESSGPYHFPPVKPMCSLSEDKKTRPAPQVFSPQPEMETSERIALLEEQVAVLMNSRWRRLGRFLGIAKPTPWEK